MSTLVIDLDENVPVPVLIMRMIMMNSQMTRRMLTMALMRRTTSTMPSTATATKQIEEFEFSLDALANKTMI